MTVGPWLNCVPVNCDKYEINTRELTWNLNDSRTTSCSVQGVKLIYFFVGRRISAIRTISVNVANDEQTSGWGRGERSRVRIGTGPAAFRNVKTNKV